jgi:hypothetical protein
VRWADADPTWESCWRQPRFFETDDQVPQPFSPSGGSHHPWELPFRFSEVEGATHYQIEVAGDAAFEDDDVVFEREVSADTLVPTPIYTVSELQAERERLNELYFLGSLPPGWWGLPVRRCATAGLVALQGPRLQ